MDASREALCGNRTPRDLDDRALVSAGAVALRTGPDGGATVTVSPPAVGSATASAE